MIGNKIKKIFKNINKFSSLKKDDIIFAKTFWTFNQDNLTIERQDMKMELKVIGNRDNCIFFNIESQKNYIPDTREYWKFKNGRIIYDLKTNSIAYNAVGLRDDIEKNNELMLNSVLYKKKCNM